MSNYLKKLTENTSFGTTEICKYCGFSILHFVKVSGWPKAVTRTAFSKHQLHILEPIQINKIKSKLFPFLFPLLL